MKDGADMSIEPTFEPCLLKDRRGWSVRVAWRYGQVEDIHGFSCKKEAEDWIRRKSQGWLSARKGVKNYDSRE